MSYVYFMRLFLQKLLQINLLLLFFLVFTLFSGKTALGASSPALVEYEKARVSYHSLLQSKKRMQKRDQWLSVIQKFNLVYEKPILTQNPLCKKIHKQVLLYVTGDKVWTS